jgi:hypothetical protein
MLRGAAPEAVNALLQIGPARLLERGGFLKLHQSADWWMLATLTDAGREALTTRDAT